MCSICVNKPEMMCRLPADHFQNERKGTKDKNPPEPPKFGIQPQLYLYLCIYLFAKRISRVFMSAPHAPQESPFLWCAHYAN